MWRPSRGTIDIFTLNPHNTVFQAETSAIGKSAEYLLEEKAQSRTINICSDIKAAIKPYRNL